MHNPQKIHTQPIHSIPRALILSLFLHDHANVERAAVAGNDVHAVLDFVRGDLVHVATAALVRVQRLVLLTVVARNHLALHLVQRHLIRYPYVLHVSLSTQRLLCRLAVVRRSRLGVSQHFVRRLDADKLRVAHGLRTIVLLRDTGILLVWVVQPCGAVVRTPQLIGRAVPRHLQRLVMRAIHGRARHHTMTNVAV